MEQGAARRTEGGGGVHIAPLPRISIQAFCESAELSHVIEDAARDRRMQKAHVKVQKGGLSAAIEAYRNSPSPNLIVIDTVAARQQLLAQLEDLAEFCDAGTKVMVIGRENDISLYRDLTSRGVSDYIVLPIDVLEFIERVSLLYNGSKSVSLGRTVAVVGAKGGVGSSTLAHNLGWTISSRFGFETVIGDLDLPFGTLALNYNQDPLQGMGEAIYSPDRLDVNFVDRLLARCGEHLSILSAPVSLDRVYDLQEQAIDPIIEILGSTVPYTILDAPHSWNGWTKRVLMSAEEVVIVACPDLANLRNTKTMIDALRANRQNDRPPRIVLNMVGVPRRPEISVSEFSAAVELQPSAVIPFDPRLFGLAANNGQMLGEVEPQSHIVETLDDLARSLTGRDSGRKGKGSLLPTLIGRFVRKRAS